MTTQETVRSYIIGELGFSGKPEELNDSYPLLESEVVDSLGLLKLVTFLENEMDIEIEDEDLIPSNFGTIANIASLVEAKQS